jgi:RimJ/RimL family protein N-acetyltransferase
MMDTMPYLPELQRSSNRRSTMTATMTTDWKSSLPVLAGARITMRELRLTDAPSLFLLLTTEEVTRFISPPPSTVEGFERFIIWAQRQRENGAGACFAVTLTGSSTAIGIFQIRDLATGFDTAEWGFAIGSPFWGTGAFEDAAALVLSFTFETLGVRRLEARAAVANGRGNGALRKLGAVPEGQLRKTFYKSGIYLDQMLYAILDDEWRARKLAPPPARKVVMSSTAEVVSAGLPC